MVSPRTRTRIIRVHRWTALLLSPVIALIVGSGIVLAFRPIVGGPRRGAAAAGAGRVDIGRVVALLEQVDPRGGAPFAILQDGRRTLSVVLPGTDSLTSFDLVTGAAVPTPPAPPPDFFSYALRVHKELWIGAGGFVTLATLALLFLVIAGPFMSGPPRDPRTARQWHVWTGWVAWPLVALLPVSLVLMKLHKPVITNRAAPPLALPQAIAIARRTLDLSQFDGAQRLPGGAMLVTDGAAGPERWVVHPDGARRFDTAVSRVGSALHEGTWAGPWSGALNVIAGLGMLWMLATGVASWTRRRGRPTAARFATPDGSRSSARGSSPARAFR